MVKDKRVSYLVGACGPAAVCGLGIQPIADIHYKPDNRLLLLSAKPASLPSVCYQIIVLPGNRQSMWTSWPRIIRGCTLAKSRTSH